MLNNITTALEALPALPAPRRAALDALLKQGLPGKKDEDWRHTDLSILDQLSAADIAPSALNHDYPSAYEDGLDALNTALSGGTQTRTLEGKVELDTGLHQRLKLKVSGDVELVLQDITPSRFATFFAEIEVAPNSRLRLLRVQQADSQAQRLTNLKILLARDAQLDAVTVDLGGRFVRNDLYVHLNEPGAGVQLYGLYAPTGSEHVDNHSWIHHRAPHCSSREFFRGVVSGSARAVFNGKIFVHEKAIKTDSETRVANLLLSKTAEVYAKPELEIYNDDVKCAHGATFGQLDEDAVYYLRARGLDRDMARALLTQAFAQEIIEHISNDELREKITQRFLSRLPQGNTSGKA
ncbi:Fe-S cluster assembly protein SufD [Stenotrophobium rhamnosiphilum]|uniref:Fe-S cluster assembly protein SufD n=1 Tax=Stenotrophobium rhamnosiphilum TaxID=2029166 RepID=A0A2T5MHV7_9GAMM|nr:Fe-S cluster assembly protein SufD [Stenotrophobium rhamnosiphilum]PTU32138.1 Fe-S cluster assembly protein SufD [Stenotrophobium rhamnosiphilum]